jgi:hypothetical protein
MRALILSLVSLAWVSSAAWAHDPDLDYILDAVAKTDCSRVQVLTAKNIGAIRWAGGSLRFLYDEDIAPLRATTLQSGKRSIEVDRAFELPNLNQPDWGEIEDRLVTDLNRIFVEDFQNHPPQGC